MALANVWKKQLRSVVFWAVIAVLAFNVLRTHAPAIKAAMRVSKPVAYTVVLDLVTVPANGSALPTHRLTWAVRGDGSRVLDMTSVPPNKPFSERIIDFAGGKQLYIMEHDAKKSTTFDLAHTSSKWSSDPTNNCLIPSSTIQQSLGEEMVDGYRTVKLTVGQAIEWRALDYGCALAKDRLEWSDGQVAEKRLVTLISGEPSPSLFDDPSGFEEIPPSQMFPGTSSTQQDKYYETHRPPKN